MPEKKYIPPTQIEYLEMQVRNAVLFVEGLRATKEKAEHMAAIADLKLPAAEEQYNVLKAELDALNAEKDKK